jgi:hypothetical protein
VFFRPFVIKKWLFQDMDLWKLMEGSPKVKKTLKETFNMKMPIPSRPWGLHKADALASRPDLPVVGGQTQVAFKKWLEEDTMKNPKKTPNLAGGSSSSSRAPAPNLKEKAKAKAKGKSAAEKKSDARASFKRAPMKKGVMSHLNLGIPDEAFPQSKNRGKFSYTVHVGSMVAEIQIKNRLYYLKKAVNPITRRSWAWSGFESPAACWEAMKAQAGADASA